MFPGTLIAALLAPIGGLVYDRLGAKKTILVGVALQVISLGLLLGCLPQATDHRLAIIYILFTLGQSISMPAIMTHGLQLLKDDDQADGNALFNTIQ